LKGRIKVKNEDLPPPLKIYTIVQPLGRNNNNNGDDSNVGSTFVGFEESKGRQSYLYRHDCPSRRNNIK